MEVCMKCSRKCLLRKKCAESPQISSFFKVMFGNKFSERLFLPPKFVRTHKLDAGRKMILKDSSGQRWNVVLSRIDGGLAFDKGWNEFLIAHGIELGDFVVFHYVVESSPQFIVQIFGKSGCEKVSVENNKKVKTSRDVSNSHANYDRFYKPQLEKHVSDRYNLSEQNDYIFKRRDKSEDVRISSPVQERDPHENIIQGLARETAWDFKDDVSFMLDRNMDLSKDVNEHIFDPSMVELPEKKTVSKKIVEMEGPSFDGSLDQEPFPNAPELGEIVPALGDPFLSALKEHGTRSRTRTPTLTPCPMPTTQSSKKAGRPTGRPKVVKQEPRAVNQARRIIVKPEVLNEEDEPIAFIPPTVASITCSVQADKDFFLLSKPLPVKPIRTLIREKKVVFLCDPVGRTWPVLYLRSHDSNVLATGWEDFVKANNIQTGNKCTFSFPDVNEAIYEVTIHSG